MGEQWYDQYAKRYPLDWQMTPAERLTILGLMQSVRPSCAIEIGTFRGGSLQVLADHADEVYSLDIDAGVASNLANFTNVHFVTGDSKETLPRLLTDLHREGTPYPFVLVDGNHSFDGVRTDVDSLLAYRPLVTTYIVLHDSFNPECRAGMLAADWQQPYVQSVEIDFIQGWFHSAEHDGPEKDRQMWGGLALAILTPEDRVGTLKVSEKQRTTFDLMERVSVHHPSTRRKAFLLTERLVGPRVATRVRDTALRRPRISA